MRRLLQHLYDKIDEGNERFLDSLDPHERTEILEASQSWSTTWEWVKRRWAEKWRGER